VDCREAQDLMNAYADHELDLVRTLDIERHINECQVCARAHQNLAALRSSLANSSFYFKAPLGLEQRIRADLRKAQPRPARRSFPRIWIPLAAAASLAVVALALWAVLRVPGASEERLLAQAVVSGHVRSLMAAHLVDVESSDQHTVKPWFDGKLDFAPDVRDFKAESFALTGGRLDYLADRPVAALVYRHDKHFINLFIWPAAGQADRGDTLTTQQGYVLIHWVQSGMNYWAVSDASEATMRRFTSLVHDRGSPTTKPLESK
jgi:anti-sigma factor RsiW